MKHALLFGKFLPFHNGHKAMIDYAVNKYERVTVVLFSRGGEQWSGELRMKWLTETYAPSPNVRAVHCPMDFCNPYDNESWAVWVKALKGIGKDVTHLVTSEDYGLPTAVLCGWEHDMFDQDRTIVPVSGTFVRNSFMKHWSHIPPATRKSLVKKVAIVGAESTGKTTISEAMARLYHTQWVPEFGREYCEWKDINYLTARDLEEIAREQLVREDEAAVKSTGLLFCDTEVIVTRAWSRHLLGFEAEKIKDKIGDYELYAATSVHVDWVQDGTRMCENKETRMFFQNFILEQLTSTHQNYVNLPARLSDAIATLQNVVDTYDWVH